MYYTSYLVSTVNEVFLVEKNKRFEATNEYEALVKLINRLVLKFEDEYKNDIIDKNIVLIVNNSELVTDLMSEDKRSDLPPSLNGLYVKIYNTMRDMNFTIIENLDGNLLSDTIIGDYSKFYKLVINLYLIIKEYQDINDEYYKKISKNDMAIQDILHFIEFSDPIMDKKVEYVDTIKKIRGDRRKIKNELAVLKQFSRPFNNISNTLNRLFNLQKSKNSYELDKYKKMFSTKEAREKLLKTL
jgi:hypothetical protein